MSDTTKTSGLQLRSLISKTGDLELSLAKVDVPEPGPDQVVVKVEATPINPSDLGLLLGPADMASFKSSGSGDGVKVTAKVPAAVWLKAIGRSINEWRRSVAYVARFHPQSQGVPTLASTRPSPRVTRIRFNHCVR